MHVIKRDGTTQCFDEDKILNAISRAMQSVNKLNLVKANEITKRIVNKVKDNITVEEIQDLVERELMKSAKDVAKSYILYRDRHDKIREGKTKLFRTLKEVMNSDARDSDILRENANTDGNAPMGIMLKVGSEASKDFYKKFVLDPEVAEAHTYGDIHIHDLDFYTKTNNCMHINLEPLLKNGFSTGHGVIREANSIETAAALACVIVQANQNDMHGGQGLPIFEYNLSPYVCKTFAKNIIAVLQDVLRSDNEFNDVFKFINELYEQSGTGTHNRTVMSKSQLNVIGQYLSSLAKTDDIDFIIKRALQRTDKCVHQSMQLILHNLCTMQSRAGSQVPFSSINYGTGTTEECRMVIRNVLKATEEGLGFGETSIFPVQIFKCKDGVNTAEGDPNYDLFRQALKTTAQRMFPNFANIDTPDNIKYYDPQRPETEYATMGMLNHGWVELYLSNKDSNITIDISSVGEYLLENCPDNVIGGKGGVKQFDQHTRYIEVKNIEIFDSIIGRWVEVKKWMCCDDPNAKWMCVEYTKGDRGFSIIATADHPLPVLRDDKMIRCEVQNIIKGDKLVFADLYENTYMDIDRVQFIENTNLKGYDFETQSDRFDVDNYVSHNCRTRVISNDVYPDKAITTGRGNLSFTTINLPRLAIDTKLENGEEICSALSENDLPLFYKKFDAIIDMVINQLLQKFKILSQKKVYNFPFLFGQGVHINSQYLGNEDCIGEAMKYCTMSIGFIGLAETLKALMGVHHGESDQAYAVGYDIIKHLRERTDNATKHLGYNFSTFATPAEGLSSRFTKLDKHRYGIIPGVTDREYYTNSFHIPVYYDISCFNKMKLEGPFHQLCNAGAITYVELDGDLTQNLDVIEKLVKFSKQCGIDYFSINHSIDSCPLCGYQGIIKGDTCPQCGWVEGTEISLEELKKKGINLRNLNLRFENEEERQKYLQTV